MSQPQWNFSYFNNESVVPGFKFKFISVSVCFNGKKKKSSIIDAENVNLLLVKKDLKSIS